MNDSTTTDESLASRFAALATDDGFADALRWRVGSREDYAALAGFHYRDAPPATVTRVLAVDDVRASAADRFLGRDPQPRCVAVLVESRPMLSAAMRDHATAGRYRAIRSLRSRAAAINAELRCISRVVVHPQYRGLGLAVRLVRRALSTATTCYTEAFAAMGYVNPFFEHAGMSAYARPLHAHDQRLAAAMVRVGVEPCDLAQLSAVLRTLDALPAGDRRWLIDELQRWHRSAFRGATPLAEGTDDSPGSMAGSLPSRLPTEALAAMFTAARKRLFCPPVYYLHARSERA